MILRRVDRHLVRRHTIAMIALTDALRQCAELWTPKDSAFTVNYSYDGDLPDNVTRITDAPSLRYADMGDASA